MSRASAARSAVQRTVLAAGLAGVCNFALPPVAVGAPPPAEPAATAAARPSAASAKTIAEIRAFEEACNKSYEKNDLKAYFDCYWDDMTQFYQQGRLDLPDYKKLWEKEIADGGGIAEIRLADMVIHVAPSNDAAVAIYRIFAKQRRAGGATIDTWNQETDVLFRRGGRWKIIHVHYSDAPKAD